MTDGYDRNQAMRDYRVWREGTLGGAAEAAAGHTEEQKLNEEVDLRRRALDYIAEYQLRFEGRRVPTPEALLAVRYGADGRAPVQRSDVLSGSTSEVCAALRRQRPGQYFSVGAEAPPQWAVPWSGQLLGVSRMVTVTDPSPVTVGVGAASQGWNRSLSSGWEVHSQQMNLARLSSSHGVGGWRGGSLAVLSAARVAADGGPSPSKCDQSVWLIGARPPPCSTQC